jgi:hypothetical protein
MRKLMFIGIMAGVFSVANGEPIKLSSLEGSERLQHSLETQMANPFLNEVQYYTYQHNLFNCGPTSIALALNSLHVPAPKAESLGNYTMFTYKNIFTESTVTKTGISEETVFKQPGLLLQQLGKILNSFSGVTAKVYYANKYSESEMNTLVINAIKSPNTVVLANIYRPAWGQPGGGHISPVSAYDEQTKSVLFMDVASFKTSGIVWVSLHELYQAMNTKDGDKYRGLVIVNYLPPKN